MFDTLLFNYLVGTLPFGLLLLKGRVAMFFGAFVVAWVPVVGTLFAVAVSLRLAKPNSWWARRFYGHGQMSEAAARYPKTPQSPAVMSAAFGWAILILFGPVAVVVGMLVYG